MLDISEKQLTYWEKLRLVAPRKNGDKTYDFRDLITLRTAKQLIDKGVSAQRLQRSIVALQKQLAEVKSPLTELRIRSNGKDVIVERAGMHLEPISGQTVLNFETRELREKVRVMPHSNADDWVSLGVEREEQSESEAGLQAAAEAYERALDLDPGHVDALNNLGMLSYEQGPAGRRHAAFSPRRGAASRSRNLTLQPGQRAGGNRETRSGSPPSAAGGAP